MSNLILFVDDDPNILAALSRQLRRKFAVETALGAETGLSAVRSGAKEYAVIVADMKMPGMNGVEFLKEVRAWAPDTVRLMLTGNSDLGTAIQAVNEGNVFRFLNKPCPPDYLERALNDALRQYKLIVAERELLENTLAGSIKVMTEILSTVAPESFQQSTKLCSRALRLAALLDVKQTWELEIGVTLSKLGHVTIPPDLLQRARAGSKLTEAEQEIIDRVPETGASMLANIPRLEGVSEIVGYQAKNYDGTGLPADNRAGEALPLGARILKVLNDIDSLALSCADRKEVFTRMEADRNSYDPQVFAFARDCFGPNAMQTGAEGQACTVGIDELREGDRLCVPVKTDNHIVIAPADTVVTRTLLRRLRNFSELGNIKEPFVVVQAAIMQVECAVS